MIAHRSIHYSLSALPAAILLLLSACQPGVMATKPQPSATVAPVILVTQTPAQPTQPSEGGQADIILDYSGVAQSLTTEIVMGQPAGPNDSFVETAPDYRRLTLQGYPVANHSFDPQIFIYPAGDLASNDIAGKIHADLQALLKTQQAGDQLPFLPVVFSSKQAFNAQLQFVDFKTGKGARFLTQFNNGLSPVNNYRLLYAFQGLTSDGKYYIAAVLPVTNPELPDEQSFSEQDAKAGKEYQDYLSQTVDLLNQQPSGSFTPDLGKLDALIRSIEVR